MTQEEKDLLLKDLCARLPYGVKINYSTGLANHCIFTLTELNVKTSYDEQYDLHYYPKLNGIYNYFDCLPYLRPMSSMTEEEKNELKQISNDYLDEWENTKTPLERWKLDAKVSYKRAVFYNSHHIDWNDLISKCLAIEVTENNNPYEVRG